MLNRQSLLYLPMFHHLSLAWLHDSILATQRIAEANGNIVSSAGVRFLAMLAMLLQYILWETCMSALNNQPIHWLSKHLSQSYKPPDETKENSQGVTKVFLPWLSVHSFTVMHQIVAEKFSGFQQYTHQCKPHIFLLSTMLLLHKLERTNNKT